MHAVIKNIFSELALCDDRLFQTRNHMDLNSIHSCKSLQKRLRSGAKVRFGPVIFEMLASIDRQERNFHLTASGNNFLADQPDNRQK